MMKKTSFQAIRDCTLFIGDTGLEIFTKSFPKKVPVLSEEPDKKSLPHIVHVPNFEGLSGSEDRGGGDNSTQFINIGRVCDKCFKEWGQK